jgi:uncharacterized repeat protein (TIGR03803 family)
MIMDSSGNLYGTTEFGGVTGPNGKGCGTVFELAHVGGTYTKLADFNFTDGSTLLGGVIMDSSGNLYGTTAKGGASNVGTVFEVAAGSRTISDLAQFDGTNGSEPYGGLVMDSSGNLYGTTSAGGANSDGTVFEVAAGSGTITTLTSFDGTDGALPQAGLIMDSSGNLYGTAAVGGANGDGTIFEVAKGSGTITVLASFAGTDGIQPGGALIMDGRGNMYGTAWGGGDSGNGVVFELPHGSGTITVLASFEGTNGANPSCSLLMDGRGNLYGTTQAGGSGGNGTVFKLPHGSGTIITLASSGIGTDGGWHSPAGLIMDNSGDLYGTAPNGGTHDDGTVFELPGAAAVRDQWTGANFAVDTNWSDGANWSLGKPPTAGQTAVFTNNPSVKSFTATVGAGFTGAVGGVLIDKSWGGTITVNGPLTVNGNFSLASGSFGGSGAVTIDAWSSQWTGGKIVVGSGGFTNNGILHANTTGGNLVLTGAGTLTNDSIMKEAGLNSLMLESSATLRNSAGATFNLMSDGSVSQSGGGTFSNAGTLRKIHGVGTSSIGTTTLDNTGTVEVRSGTLDISAAVAQVSGGTLTAGRLTVFGSATLPGTLDITSAGSLTTLGAGVKVTLKGPRATFTNLSGLATIDRGARFSLLRGQSFTTTGALTNDGRLTLSPGSVLTVGGSFTQASTGTLTIQVGGTDTAPTAGQLLSSTGTVALAGKLNVTSTVVPAVGSAFELLDYEGNAAVSGTFAGLPEGSTFTVTAGGTTMTLQITYVGADADGNHNVLITRTA